MNRARFVLVSAAAILVSVACVGCEEAVDAGSRDPGQARSASRPTIEEQALIVSGRESVDLVPIEDAQSWLQNADLAAYADPDSHDEFIADTAREELLSYIPGTAIYQDPIDLAMYEGEPSRQEVTAHADSWAGDHAPGYDISTMRRTAWRRVAGTDDRGDLLEYLVEYRSYVDGVRVPGWVNVTVMLPTWSWEPAVSGFDHATPYGEIPVSRVTILEAVSAAAAEAGMADYSVGRAELAMQDGGLRWMIELRNEVDDPAVLGEGAAWIQVDAVTGEVAAVANTLSGSGPSLSSSEAYLATDPPPGWLRSVGQDDGFVLVFETPARFKAAGAWEYKLILFNETDETATLDLLMGLSMVADGAPFDSMTIGLSTPIQREPRPPVVLGSGEATVAARSDRLQNAPYVYEVVGVARAGDLWSQTETVTVVSE